MITNYFDKIPEQDRQTELESSLANLDKHGGGDVRFQIFENAEEVWCEVFTDADETTLKVLVFEKERAWYPVNSQPQMLYVSMEGEPVMESQTVSLLGNGESANISDEVRVTDPRGNLVSPPGGEIRLWRNQGQMVMVNPVPVYEDHGRYNRPIAFAEGWEGAPSYLVMAHIPATQTVRGISNHQINGLETALDILRDAGLIDDE